MEPLFYVLVFVIQLADRFGIGSRLQDRIPIDRLPDTRDPLRELLWIGAQVFRRGDQSLMGFLQCFDERGEEVVAEVWLVVFSCALSHQNEISVGGSKLGKAHVIP